MRKNDKPKLVRARNEVQQNQTGSGFIQDRRTKRERDRSTRERRARERSQDEE